MVYFPMSIGDNDLYVELQQAPRIRYAEQEPEPAQEEKKMNQVNIGKRKQEEKA